jgi:hypothetical protein
MDRNQYAYLLRRPLKLFAAFFVTIPPAQENFASVLVEDTQRRVDWATRKTTCPPAEDFLADPFQVQPELPNK